MAEVWFGLQLMHVLQKWLRQPCFRWLLLFHGWVSDLQVKFVKGNTLAMARIQVEKLICVEKFENVPQLGRFTLRDEGRTIAVGKIERLPKSAKA